MKQFHLNVFALFLLLLPLCAARGQSQVSLIPENESDTSIVRYWKDGISIVYTLNKESEFQDRYFLLVDTSFANAPECPVVSGLFLRGNYTDTVTVQWDYDSLHPEYQLWYGPEADFETHNAMVSLRTNSWVFSDASYADKQMIAYVRTVCHEYDTLRYSEWGRPIRFMLHHEEQDTTGHGDIGVPEAGDDLARFVQLMPNPASGSVMVSSSYVIRRVEAYDVRGEKVMDRPTEGRTAAFDVSSWPKGAYVLLVRTPAGTATKRLVVQ